MQPPLLATLQQKLQNVATRCQPNLNTTATWDQKGAAWGPDWCGVGGGYSHLLAPNKPACFFSNATGDSLGQLPGNDDITMIGAQSFHSGRVNVGFEELLEKKRLRRKKVRATPSLIGLNRREYRIGIRATPKGLNPWAL